MNQNENKALMKTMFKCGLHLLMFAGALAIIVGIAKVTTFYADNIWSAVLFVNNLFLPSKHFIQENIWYFIGSSGIFLLWLICVFTKTPNEHVKSLAMLIKILLAVYLFLFIFMLCLADMKEGGLSAILFISAFALLFFGLTIVYDLITNIANTKLKQIKEIQ